jgi:hypothetical protein
MKTRIRQNDSARENNPTKTAQGIAPTVEEIRQRAQEIFMARGGAPGMELDDWLLAERELKHARAKADRPRFTSMNYERNST